MNKLETLKERGDQLHNRMNTLNIQLGIYGTTEELVREVVKLGLEAELLKIDIMEALEEFMKENKL